MRRQWLRQGSWQRWWWYCLIEFCNCNWSKAWRINIEDNLPALRSEKINKPSWEHHDYDNDCDKGEDDDDDLVWLSFAIASGAAHKVHCKEKWQGWHCSDCFFNIYFFFKKIQLFSYLFFPTTICFTQSALRRGMTRATLFRFIKIYLFSFYLFVWFSIKPYINNVFFLHIISFTSEARSNTTFQMRR